LLGIVAYLGDTISARSRTTTSSADSIILARQQSNAAFACGTLRPKHVPYGPANR
jgi:hypothetical protein